MGVQTTQAQRWIAFLRAINVGGHTVKMTDLRQLFEALGLSNVETFIASGNVIFTSAIDAPTLEQQIARHLQEALGYPVGTFIRSAAELAAIASYEPFPPEELSNPDALFYIAFLPRPPSAAAQQKLLAACTATDDFHIHERELYWLRRNRFSDSIFSGALLEKTLGLPATVRNVTTVRKLAAKYAPAP